MRGARFRWDDWQTMFTDENESQILMIPVPAGEVDPEWPPKPLTPQAREDALKDVIVGVARAYQRFVRKAPSGSPSPSTFRRPARKIGRHEHCPCGSGKKFEHCCSGAGDGEPALQ